MNHACYTVANFRTRLRFPRAAGEPPCCLRSYRVSLFLGGVFTLPSNQQLEALHTVTYVNNHHKKIRTSWILNQEFNSFGPSFNEITFVRALFFIFYENLLNSRQQPIKQTIPDLQ